MWDKNYVQYPILFQFFGAMKDSFLKFNLLPQKCVYDTDAVFLQVTLEKTKIDTVAASGNVWASFTYKICKYFAISITPKWQL